MSFKMSWGGGVQKKMKCHGEGGSDEYFSVDHGKLNVMGRGGNQKLNVGEGGVWKKLPAHPPHCHFKWNRPKEEGVFDSPYTDPMAIHSNSPTTSSAYDGA